MPLTIVPLTMIMIVSITEQSFEQQICILLQIVELKSFGMLLIKGHKQVISILKSREREFCLSNSMA